MKEVKKTLHKAKVNITEMRELLDQGISQSAIARHFKCSRQRISQLIQKIEYDYNRMEELKNIAVELYKDGLDMYSIADSLEISYTTVRRAINNEGLELKSPTLIRRSKMIKDGLSDREIADVEDITLHAIQSWRHYNSIFRGLRKSKQPKGYIVAMSKYKPLKDGGYTVAMVLEYNNNKSIEGEYIDCRMDRSGLPKGLYAYDVRHSDDGDILNPVTIEEHVYVNFMGTVVFSKPLDFENMLFTFKNSRGENGVFITFDQDRDDAYEMYFTE